MSQQVSIPAPPPSASQSKRFECSIPGCVKVFRRKEHLTRHQKSHNTELPYVCNICGRRYARSDVLKRHVEFHPQYYKPRRNFVACVRCRESKTRCDDKTTCMACHRKSVECVRPEPEPHVIVGDSTSKAFPDLSAPAAPKSHLDKLPDDVDLEQYVLRETASVMSRFQVYFSIIHPIWPILNPPSSPTDVYPSTLTMSVVMLASWIEGDNDHLTLAPWIFGQLSNVDLNPDPPLHMLQTMVLCMVYALSNLVAEGMASRALKLHNTLVTLCRCAGILDGQNGTFNQVRKASTPVEVQEQRHRIALAALRIDAYFSVLTDMPPLIRFQELVMPLTATAIWTNAINDEEGRTLGERQTMMRKKTTFAFLVSDMLGVPRQNEMAPRWTKMDYHFVLCGLQSGVWESGHYALRSVADELYSRSRHEHPRPAGRQRLENWSLSLETDCQLRKNYFSDVCLDEMTPQILLLPKLMGLINYAPIELLQLSARYLRLRSIHIPVCKDSSEHYLVAWQQSTTGRMAAWHSAQLAGIMAKECAMQSPASRMTLNPLAIPAILLSAYTICAYTYRLHTCPKCTGSPPVDIVNIFEAPPHCQRLSRWKAEGVGIANWGTDNFIMLEVCHCGLGKIVDWFRALLAPRDKQAEASLMVFLDELQRDCW